MQEILVSVIFMQFQRRNNIDGLIVLLGKEKRYFKKLMKAKIPFVGIKILLQPFIVADEKVAEFTICSILDDSFRLEVMTMKVEVC